MSSEELSTTCSCDCGAVNLVLKGTPLISCLCHCTSCQVVTKAAFSAVTAWKPEAVTITGTVSDAKLPGRQMNRVFCGTCGVTLYNTNRFNLYVIQQGLIRRCQADGRLPEGFTATKHLFYGERVVDVADSLPKYIEGIDGPLLEAEA